MDIIKHLLPSFLFGGFLVASIKYTAEVMKNTKISAVLGGLPLGLISIYFLNDQAAYGYGINYGVITSILLFSVIVFNILYEYFGLSKNISHGISLLTWLSLAMFRTFY